MTKKKLISEAEARALIVKEAKYRVSCEDFEPLFKVRRAEPDPETWRYPRANWDATLESPQNWPSDCVAAFHDAVTRNRGKYDIVWPRFG